MHRSLQDISLHRRPLARLEAMPNKPQMMSCPQCGHQWIGLTTTCPSCKGVAKSEGEMTKKVMDDPDLRKGLR